ncbi:ParB/RepB/Spo0J family partition protein [Pedococcus sp. 5OH_020]|uniref:ParB/RepB/Spo0J family partition protein n=1 Tax=Pedococcus sp. 5OH_020 TaxID=2989814 RepID=UPI0022E9BBFE|nr:ParB N-terminal domain-containing protein [Pedococcus sp. 5OH_020]
MNNNTRPDAQVTIEMVDPASLVLADNVRSTAALDQAFVASIKEHGVLQAITGTRDDNGQIRVRYGQRRTLAAIEAGLGAVPVMVVQATGDDADRIVQQLGENDHRQDLSAADRLGAYEQLAALGLTAAQITRRTRRPKAEVQAALTVTGSELAAKAVGRFEFLTLDQAATIADFDDDPDTVKLLTVAAREGQFEHLAQRLRDDRDRDQARTALVEQLTGQGVNVVEQPAYDDATVRPLHRLAPTHGGAPFDADGHASCAGHAAYVTVSPRWADDDTGREVRVYEAQATFVCTRWKAEGHVDTYARGSDAKPKAAALSPQQREQAKAERRDVVESNKAWDAAEPVRRSWVAQFLTRKTPPKGTASIVAHLVTQHGDALSTVGGDHLAAEWFGLTPASYGASTGWGALIDKATEPRATVIALGRLLAGCEKDTSRDSWRRVSPRTSAYLRFLAANGYDLSEVEKRAAGLTKKK